MSSLLQGFDRRPNQILAAEEDTLPQFQSQGITSRRRNDPSRNPALIFDTTRRNISGFLDEPGDGGGGDPPPDSRAGIIEPQKVRSRKFLDKIQEQSVRANQTPRWQIILQEQIAASRRENERRQAIREEEEKNEVMEDTITTNVNPSPVKTPKKDPSRRPSIVPYQDERALTPLEQALRNSEDEDRQSKSFITGKDAESDEFVQAVSKQSRSRSRRRAIMSSEDDEAPKSVKDKESSIEILAEEKRSNPLVNVLSNTASGLVRGLSGFAEGVWGRISQPRGRSTVPEDRRQGRWDDEMYEALKIRDQTRARKAQQAQDQEDTVQEMLTEMEKRKLKRKLDLQQPVNVTTMTQSANEQRQLRRQQETEINDQVDQFLRPSLTSRSQPQIDDGTQFENEIKQRTKKLIEPIQWPEVSQARLTAGRKNELAQLLERIDDHAIQVARDTDLQEIYTSPELQLIRDEAENSYRNGSEMVSALNKARAKFQTYLLPRITLKRRTDYLDQKIKQMVEAHKTGINLVMPGVQAAVTKVIDSVQTQFPDVDDPGVTDEVFMRQVDEWGTKLAVQNEEERRMSQQQQEEPEEQQLRESLRQSMAEQALAFASNATRQEYEGSGRLQIARDTRYKTYKPEGSAKLNAQSRESTLDAALDPDFIKYREWNEGFLRNNPLYAGILKEAADAPVSAVRQPVTTEVVVELPASSEDEEEATAEKALADLVEADRTQTYVSNIYEQSAEKYAQYNEALYDKGQFKEADAFVQDAVNKAEISREKDTQNQKKKRIEEENKVIQKEKIRKGTKPVEQIQAEEKKREQRDKDRDPSTYEDVQMASDEEKQKKIERSATAKRTAMGTKILKYVEQAGPETTENELAYDLIAEIGKNSMSEAVYQDIMQSATGAIWRIAKKKEVSEDYKRRVSKVVKALRNSAQDTIDSIWSRRVHNAHRVQYPVDVFGVDYIQVLQTEEQERADEVIREEERKKREYEKSMPANLEGTPLNQQLKFWKEEDAKLQQRLKNQRARIEQIETDRQNAIKAKTQARLATVEAMKKKYGADFFMIEQQPAQPEQFVLTGRGPQMMSVAQIYETVQAMDPGASFTPVQERSKTQEQISSERIQSRKPRRVIEDDNGEEVKQLDFNKLKQAEDASVRGDQPFTEVLKVLGQERQVRKLKRKTEAKISKVKDSGKEVYVIPDMPSEAQIMTINKMRKLDVPSIRDPIDANTQATLAQAGTAAGMSQLAALNDKVTIEKIETGKRSREQANRLIEANQIIAAANNAARNSTTLLLLASRLDDYPDDAYTNQRIDSGIFEAMRNDSTWAHYMELRRVYRLPIDKEVLGFISTKKKIIEEMKKDEASIKLKNKWFGEADAWSAVLEIIKDEPEMFDIGSSAITQINRGKKNGTFKSKEGQSKSTLQIQAFITKVISGWNPQEPAEGSS